MNKTILVNYDKVEKENLRKSLARRELNRYLKKVGEEPKNGSVILLRTPAEEYFDSNMESVKFFLDNGFEGVYMSFQRPFKNLSSFFERQGVNMNKLFVIDGATAFSGETQEKNPRCVHISPDFEIEDMIKKVCSSLSKLNSEKRFVFIDSLTTLALYEPMSETMRFPENMIRIARKKEFGDVTVVFNVAEDLTQKRYIQNIAVYADEHIHLGLCT